MRITNPKNNTVLADKARIANTFITRLIGLLNRKALDKGEALVLSPSNCIHSLFMRFTFDALFLDKSGKVVGIFPSFKPFRVSPLYTKSFFTIELPAGTIASTQTRLGDSIVITPD